MAHLAGAGRVWGCVGRNSTYPLRHLLLALTALVPSETLARASPPSCVCERLQGVADLRFRPCPDVSFGMYMGCVG